MNGYLGILGASVTTFALTNIDDACLLTLLFAQRIPARRIVAGQYLGFAVIVVVSLLGAFAALADLVLKSRESFSEGHGTKKRT